MESSDRTLCGWRVRSALPLPELLPWSGDDRTPDIDVRLGAVPDRLEDEIHTGPFVRIGRDGRVRFSMEGVASYLIRGGREVTVDARLPLDAPDLSLFFLGTVFGVLCHQRGALPLHASCLAFGERAVAFAGPSRAGKSTLAAALMERGHRLLSDDVTVLRFPGGGAPLVEPGFPRQKLWADALEAFSLGRGRRVRSKREFEKYERSAAELFQAEPLPLAAVCHLSEARLPVEHEIERLEGVKALEAVRGAVYRLSAGAAMGGGQRIFMACGALSGRVPQFLLRRREGFDPLRRLAADLPHLLAGA